MDLSLDEQALLDKFATLKRVQSSGGEASPCERKRPPESDAERRAKLHEAAKQALLASSPAQNDASAQATAVGALDHDVSGTSDDEPLAQPKREEKKGRPVKKKSSHTTILDKPSARRLLESHILQETGKHAARCAGTLPRQSADAEAMGAQMMSGSSPATAEAMHDCYSINAVTTDAGQASMPDLAASIGKCELVYDDI